VRSYPRWFGLILASILLSGCAANNEPEINPTTGMPKILCGVKPVLEKVVNEIPQSNEIDKWTRKNYKNMVSLR
jgi:hypothetical protein